MLVIQALLIIVATLVLIKILSGRGTHTVDAWKKIAIIFLCIGMVVAILFPPLVTSIANTIGIGRGTDLLVYLLFSAFIFYVMEQYVKYQDEKDKLIRLARKVAINEASLKYSSKMKFDN